MAETATLKRPLVEPEETKDTTNGSESTETEKNGKDTEKNGSETEKNGTETEKNGTNGTTPIEPLEKPVESDDQTNMSSFFKMTKRSKKGTTMEQDAMRRFGMAAIVPDFTNEDMKIPPWTDISRKLYREKKTLHDPKLASEWMRWWFKEHDGMPHQPTRALQSAFILWQQEKMAATGTKIGDKKERKRLGAEWKALTEEEQAPWADKLAIIREEYEKAEVSYEEKLEAWREDKLKRVAKRGERTDGEKDCTCVYCIGEDAINSSLNQGRGRT